MLWLKSRLTTGIFILQSKPVDTEQGSWLERYPRWWQGRQVGGGGDWFIVQ